MIATGNHSYYGFAARSTTGVAIRSPNCSFIIEFSDNPKFFKETDSHGRFAPSE